MTLPFRDRTAIVGVGHSGCSKDAGKAMPLVWLDAICAAVDDAGLTLADIDGICTPYQDTRSSTPQPTPFVLTRMLGLPGLRWHGAPLGQAYALGSVASAATAVASGMCTTALAFHAMERPKERGSAVYNYRGAPEVGGVQAFLAPYGYSVFVQIMAAWCQRMLATGSLTRAQLAKVAVDQRAAALLNPHAVMRTPLLPDDYFAARWIAEPLCLYDVDMPVDGAVAVIITSAERAVDLRQAPIAIANVGGWLGPQPDWVFHGYDRLFPEQYAVDFWRAAGLGPEEMSLAALHDGFTVYVPLWLEALGLAPAGEGGAMIESGALSRGGRLPNNTHGGNLSEGRLQGAGGIVESVVQLRHQAGPRQVPDASAAIVSVGGSPTLCAAVLHR
jgi:acetyl-CoA acetyltransferase